VTGRRVKQIRRRSDAVVGTVILGLALASVVAGFWQRFARSDVQFTLQNDTDTARVIRVTDGSSGRPVATLRVEAHSISTVFDGRLDIWWRDLTAEEQAAGRTARVGIEVLALKGCGLTTATTGTGEDAQLALEVDGLAWYGQPFDEGATPSDLDVAPRAVTRPAVVVADPCGGKPADPVGLIANRTKVPIVVSGRVVVGPCDAIGVGPGDLRDLVSTREAGRATAIRAPSLDIQGARWPLEPRSIIVTRYDLSDEEGADLDPSAVEDCAGKPLADHDEMYPPDDPTLP
jgi:hypothetical protein